MKTLRTFLTAAALLQPALPTLAQAQASSYSEQDQKKVVEAAYALAYRALKVSEAAQNVSDNDGHPALRKATRLAQQIRWRALDIADQLQKSSGGSSIGRLLDESESLVFQLDATKRELLSSHRNERDLQKALNDVRRTYYVLKQALSGNT